MHNDPIMKLGDFKKILSEITNEIGDDAEIWLSRDEEGNEFLPLSANQEWSIGIEKKPSRIVLFPI